MTAATKNPSKAAVDAAAQAEADYLAAEREAVAADEHAEALAERVREGDDTVTAEQLDAAQKAGMFARLRAEAAQRKARRAAEAAEQAHRQALTEQAVTLVDEQADPVSVAKAYEQARAAVAALVNAVDTHDGAVRQAAALLREAGAPPIIEYHRVEHAEGYATSEPRRMPASRTVPRVAEQAAALALDDDRTHTEIGAGPLLAVLFAEAAADVPMPTGEPALTRAPLDEHARRHGDQVRRFLAHATEGAAQ